MSQRWPWRMIVLGAFRDNWIDASQEERQRVFDAWLDVHQTWIEAGCRLLATMDDLTREYSRDSPNFYTVWEIPDPALVHALSEALGQATSSSEIKLSRYFSLEFALGKPIVSMERGLGGAQRPTPPRDRGEFM